MRLYDCHVHMADIRLQSDFQDVLKRMENNNVRGCMVICDPGDLEPDHEKAIEIVRLRPEFALSIACHPQNALHYCEETEAIIRRTAALPFLKCIGETGLDFYDNASTREQQLFALERQMDLALEFGLPVQLHIRNAHGEMCDILRRRKKEHRLPLCVVHCFTRSSELAKEYLRLGCYISVGGPVTYTNANKLLTAVRDIPLDRLLIETDSPWIAPEPYKGQSCEPSFITPTFDKAAELKGMAKEELSEILWNNAVRVFHLSDNI